MNIRHLFFIPIALLLILWVSFLPGCDSSSDSIGSPPPIGEEATTEALVIPPPETTIPVSPTPALKTPTVSAEHAPQTQTFNDPAGQFTLDIPYDWKLDEATGSYRGANGFFQTAYLPEMGYMQHAGQVCMRLANPPQGPTQMIYLGEDGGCILVPLAQPNQGAVRWVFEYPTDQTELRFFYIEASTAHIAKIIESLVLKESLSGSYRVPSGPIPFEDVGFWENVGELPPGWRVEEMRIIENPANPIKTFSLINHIPRGLLGWPLDQDEFQAKSTLTASPDGDNGNPAEAILAKFGYSIVLKESSGAQYGHPLYQLFHENEMVLDNVDTIGPVTTTDDGSDFAITLSVINDYDYLVTKGGAKILELAIRVLRETPPQFLNNQLVAVYWDPSRNQLQIRDEDETLYSFAPLYGADSGLKAFVIRDSDWFLEVNGFLIQNGVILNETLEYDRIFDLNFVHDKALFFFRKGPRVAISYDGQILPLFFDEVYHLGCCGTESMNPNYFQNRLGFLALRGGVWYYVKLEMGE